MFHPSFDSLFQPFLEETQISSCSTSHSSSRVTACVHIPVRGPPGLLLVSPDVDGNILVIIIRILYVRLVDNFLELCHVFNVDCVRSLIPKRRRCFCLVDCVRSLIPERRRCFCLVLSCRRSFFLTVCRSFVFHVWVGTVGNPCCVYWVLCRPIFLRSCLH